MEATKLSSSALRAIRSIVWDGWSITDELELVSNCELRPFLASLVRIALLPPLFPSEIYAKRLIELRARILPIFDANLIIELLKVNFAALQKRLTKQRTLEEMEDEDAEIVAPKKKAWRADEQQNFETAEPFDRFLIILRRVLSRRHDEQYFEPFDNVAFFADVCDILCIALFELPQTVTLNMLLEPLLYYRHGPKILAVVAANSWPQFDEVLLALLAKYGKDEDGTFLNAQRCETVASLVEVAPEKLDFVLNELSSRRILPNLALMLLYSSCNMREFAEKIAHLLLLSQPNSSFGQYFHSQSKKPLENVSSEFRNFTAKLISFTCENGADQVAFLRMICVLKSVSNVKFGCQVLEKLFKTVCRRFPVTDNSRADAVKMALTTLLVCPSIFSSTFENELTEWFRWLLADEDNSGTTITDESYGEFLLLFAIQLHSSAFETLADMLSAELGFKVSLSAKGLSRVRSAVMAPGSPLCEEALTGLVGRAARSSLTTTASNLPLHCVLHLLKGRAFSKNKIPIGDWILQQIRNVRCPVDDRFVELVDIYAASCLNVVGLGTAAAASGGQHSRRAVDKSAKEAFNEPLNEAQLLALFPTDDLPSAEDAGPQLVALYYILCYDHYLVQAAKSQAAPTAIYSDSLLEAVPIRYLLSLLTDGNRKGLIGGKLKADLFKLASIQLPYLLPDAFIRERRPSSDLSSVEIENLCQRLVAVFSSADEFGYIRSDMSRILVSGQQILHLLPILVSCLYKSLCNKLPKFFWDEIWQLYRKLEAVSPRKVYAATISALVGQGYKLSNKDLVEDPLICLKISKSAFENPYTAGIALDACQFYLEASKISLRRQVTLSASVDYSGYEKTAGEIDNEREELLTAVIRAQDSAAVQILLELCREGVEETTANLSHRQEISCKICSLVHRLFIQDPLLVKLVHFQGYALDVLPILVKGVPSMHICLDFVAEMLAQPDNERRLFATQLLACLCEQFTVPSAASRARLCVDVYSQLLGSLPTSEALALLSRAGEPLSRMAALLPPLRRDVSTLLSTTARLAQRARRLSPHRSVLAFD